MVRTESRIFRLPGSFGRKTAEWRKPSAPVDIAKKKNNGSTEVDDCILCLGYLPDSEEKCRENRGNGKEEANDCISCLGY